MQVTSGHFTIGVNPRHGIIYFLNRASPASAARYLWDVPSVKPDELPALRSSSDIAWGLWRRQSDHLWNINYFFSVDVINVETCKIIARAVANRGYSHISAWPGISFEPWQVEFSTILGKSHYIPFSLSD